MLLLLLLLLLLLWCYYNYYHYHHQGKIKGRRSELILLMIFFPELILFKLLLDHSCFPSRHFYASEVELNFLTSTAKRIYTHFHPPRKHPGKTLGLVWWQPVNTYPQERVKLCCFVGEPNGADCPGVFGWLQYKMGD